MSAWIYWRQSKYQDFIICFEPALFKLCLIYIFLFFSVWIFVLLVRTARIVQKFVLVKMVPLVPILMENALVLQAGKEQTVLKDHVHLKCGGQTVIKLVNVLWKTQKCKYSHFCRFFSVLFAKCCYGFLLKYKISYLKLHFRRVINV